MEYDNLVKDFAYRTRKNLDALRELHETEPDRVYEVTQLINSMLGLLIFPQQQYIDAIPEISLDELKQQGWPIPRVMGVYPQVSNLKQLVRYLRNAIAHFNLKFRGNGAGQIAGLCVWNEDPRTNTITWMAELTVEDLEKITDKFTEQLLKS